MMRSPTFTASRSLVHEERRGRTAGSSEQVDQLVETGAGCVDELDQHPLLNSEM